MITEFTSRIFLSATPLSIWRRSSQCILFGVIAKKKVVYFSFGKVIAAQVVTNERGSKGFGFVTLDTAIGCDHAREQLDGTIMGGRKIEVTKDERINESIS